jgi:hypothetical protein
VKRQRSPSRLRSSLTCQPSQRVRPRLPAEMLRLRPPLQLLPLQRRAANPRRLAGTKLPQADHHHPTPTHREPPTSSPQGFGIAACYRARPGVHAREWVYRSPAASICRFTLSSSTPSEALYLALPTLARSSMSTPEGGSRRVGHRRRSTSWRGVQLRSSVPWSSPPQGSPRVDANSACFRQQAPLSDSVRVGSRSNSRLEQRWSFQSFRIASP